MKILAVCFCLAFCSTGIEGAVNSGKIYQLQQKLIEKPSDKEAMLHLAMEYSLRNNFVKAVETYFSLLRVDPNNFHAYNNLGILYKKSGQFRDSIHCYQQAQRIDPDSYWVPYNMGLCYESMGLMQEARESYGRALSLNPGFTQALQRLRNLTEGGAGTVPVLPSMPDSQILIADGKTTQPRKYGQENIAFPVKAKPVNSSKDVKPIKETPEPEKISTKLIENKKKKNEKVRTRRKGPSADIFNQAMEALEDNKIERAVELYARCVISDREFLAEPEGDLIKKGLEFLKDRPNRIEDGLFYRGFLVSVSGNLELAALDMRGYLEQQKSNGKTGDSLFEKEALRISQRFEAELAQRKEMEQRAKEEAAAEAAAREMASQSGDENGQEIVQKPSEFLLKRMNVDEIIDEADKLSRSSRQADAIAVLKAGLEKDPDNLRLLMKSANSYTDLLLLKGDQEAGKMALMQFDRILGKAPEKSQEWAVAQEMIKELKGRVRP